MKSLRILLALMFALALLGFQTQTSHAQEGCEPGSMACVPAEEGTTVEPQANAAFKSVYSALVKGSYVAHGVGMRNTGYGTIRVSDVPPGAAVKKAYLFWAVIGPSSLPGVYYWKGKINGVNITASLIGSTATPGWGLSTYKTWGYRADVTSRMKAGGNGVYALTGFASGNMDGSDPFDTGSVAPLLEGATLVIVYTHPGAPQTLIKIQNGPNYVETHELHLITPAMNATGMTGLTRTTFIVADGQSNLGEPGPYFFTSGLDFALSGADPNGAGGSYLNGNLWDTRTVDLTYLLDPPETDFWYSLGGGPDAIVWVAQVSAYATGNQDSDGDRIKDYWELFGYSGLNLPGWGASPIHKDLFVEADYMRPNSDHDHLPAVAQLDDAVAVFAAAPILNADGVSGINLHIDTGGAAYGAAAGTYSRFALGGGNVVTEDTNLGTSDAGCNYYDWGEFDVVKNANYDVYRSGIFHYMIFAHNLAPCFGTVSGISRNGGSDAQFIKGAHDFIVSMGGWGSMGTSEQREGTFIHEFGHNLGLRHGGNDHKNYKPNYLSVMNYAFQTGGVIYNGSAGRYDYSRFQLPNLNESALVEGNGLGPLAASYGTRYYSCSTSGTTVTWAGSNIDWNCNGYVLGTVAADINKDGVFSTLGTQNNWANITFLGGGTIGLGAEYGEKLSGLAITTRVDELDYETYLEHGGEPVE